VNVIRPDRLPDILSKEGDAVSPAPAAEARCGWHGSIRRFLDTKRTDWLESLEKHHLFSLKEVASQANRTAWLNCHGVLQDQLARLVGRRCDANDWGIAFEYELPRERGRRPDIVVLAGQHVLVLEFKDFRDTLPAHVDQVAGYARDLASYQEASHEHDVIPILVNTLSTSGPVEWKSVWITGAAGLADCMERSGATGESWMPVEDLDTIALCTASLSCSGSTHDLSS
jgi:hypothetical protein